MDIIFLKHIDQFRERRCHPDTVLIFDALITLFQHFVDDQRKIRFFPLIFRLVEIHKHRNKR